ncbi:A24 family peptidase [Pectinatus frisingensis]|uniref:prepilin peptidase n=1 Tax=Pectinatus frisingensis TaxID=865 RepID=UPI0018C64E2D|nr:A24 family peptidase [Pectinatus frisingensis]
MNTLISNFSNISFDFLYYFPTNIFEQTVSTLSLLYLLTKISYIDYKTLIIPNKLLLPLLIIGALHQTMHRTNISLLDIGFSLLFISFIFLPIYFLTNSLGGGDVKMSYCLAVWLPYPLITAAITIAVLSAVLTGIFLIKCHKASITTPMPFGPFLSLGGSITFLLSEELMRITNYWCIL